MEGGLFKRAIRRLFEKTGYPLDTLAKNSNGYLVPDAWSRP